jgi:8-amino-7-oxononanoate synthase
MGNMSVADLKKLDIGRRGTDSARVAELMSELARLESAGRYRRRRIQGRPQQPESIVDGRPLLSFCSNDYLGLANHPDVIAALQAGAERWGVGSGSAHLVNGHCAAHEALEEELAEFTGRARALLFSTGYMANLGVISASGRTGSTMPRCSMVRCSRAGRCGAIPMPMPPSSRVCSGTSRQV